MDAWDTAVQFLLIDDRAQSLAEAHPLMEDGQCGRCSPPGCTAAALAAEALAILAARLATDNGPFAHSAARVRSFRPGRSWI
jgi:hypothetical protein